MNRILLDTQPLLYAVMNSPKLSTQARQIYDDPNIEKLLSYASVWEMAIKLGIGKLRLDEPLGLLLKQCAADRRLTLVPLELDHLLAIEHLPSHHGDPFDRLLAAFAFKEDLDMLSSDTTLDFYGVRRVW